MLLVHPGGPYWAHTDEEAWSIPKGECSEGEHPLETARREFAEETGSQVTGPFQPLTPLTQQSGKMVSAWAAEGDLDPTSLRSNSVSLEWPPHSGQRQDFPEVDRGDWFDLAVARAKLQPGQRGFLDQLQELLKDREAD